MADDADASPDPHSNGAIEDAASRWVIVNTGGNANPDEKRAFDAWYAADPRHARIYGELMEIWDRLSAVDADAMFVVASKNMSVSR